MTTTTDGLEAHIFKSMNLVYHVAYRCGRISEWYAPADLPFGEDAFEYMEHLAESIMDRTGPKKKKNLDLLLGVPLYRKHQNDDLYEHITKFHHRDDIYTRFDPMTKEEKNAVSRKTKGANRQGSMKMLRRFVTGDENGIICCGRCGDLVDGVIAPDGRLRWLGQIHHMAFKARQSKNKEGPDPSKNFVNANLYEPEDMNASVTKKLMDITSCIVLCPSCHTWAHLVSSGDIKMWKNDQLAHALQNKENWADFIAFCVSRGYPAKAFKSFTAQIKHQKL